MLTKEGIICNPDGHPLTYEVGSCGDEVLFDALEFSVCIQKNYYDVWLMLTCCRCRHWPRARPIHHLGLGLGRVP